MDDIEEEEDVIIEGSELHRTLVNLGYTDFEFTPVNKNDSLPKESSTKRFKWYEKICNFFKRLHTLNGSFDYAPKIRHISSKQFATILRAESLLDDHAALVQSFAEENSQTFWNKFAEWSGLLVSTAMLGIGYSMFKRKKTLAMFVATSIAVLRAYREYREFQAVRALKNVVTVQNELYRSYKRSLGILRNVYRLRIDEKKIQAKFSKLEIDRLKYLQPFTETLLKSMENVSSTYYRASTMIVRLLPKNSLENHTLTHFENDEFAIEGEVTYEKLRRLYYVYVLVQSDIMQLLAIAYNADSSLNDETISHSLLTRIIVKLCRSLTNEKKRLVRIVMEYESCKRRTIERKVRVASASKWKDIYLNLDLMSRKLLFAYDEIGSLLEEIEKRENNDKNEDNFIDVLAARNREIYSNIEKSRNFAEFNNLLIAILQRTRRIAVDPIHEVDARVTEIEDDRIKIVRDSEPQIIDEVFEEYITEEYLKPLYEESDEATMEIAKFDGLLAKNFMCELKEVLVEKYKSMSEREAKALLRRYRATSEISKIEDNNAIEVVTRVDDEKSIIPSPPPLPGFSARKGKIGSRRPVPLPRLRNVENISQQKVPQRFNYSLPPPPPPPIPPALSPSNDESFEITERFSINLPNFGALKMPAFVTFAEEFIGSGENSDEELEEKSDKDDDES